MILYTYECPKCGQFEERREANDREHCDKCGSPVRKIFGGAFKLYGPGFYSTEDAVSRVTHRR